MRVLVGAVLCFGAAAATATPLDDYLNKPEPDYQWHDTHDSFKTEFGGTAHVINVTSQKWLDVSKAIGPNGALWTHQVIVVVPKTVKHKNMSVAYLTGNCNEAPVGIPSKTDEELLLVDTLTHDTGIIGIIVYQLPNCHIVYPSDPSKKGRSEDAMIAWAWNEYLHDPMHNPEWLPRLPMAKGAFQSMRAAAEFIKTLDPTHVVSGWFVAGASKRGWTTWMVGAATCDSCVNIIGIAPLVPIVPSLQKEIHRMFQAYGGFTFAFADYQAINLTEHVDDPVFKGLTDVVDPINYLDRLARIPVYPVLSSDDEFMMMDWTNIWYDEMKAALPEMHLLIAPNSEHSLATGVPEVVESLQTFISSLAVGQTTRPNFEYTRHNKTGELSVKIDAGFTPTSVVLRHAQTLQTKRRDFRWIRLANEKVGTCTLPDIALPKPIFGANCLVPIVWYSEDVKLNADGEYKAKPPTPKPGHWAAYYIEVKFKSGTESISEYHFSTPGYTWPDTLPFHDCHGAGCIGPDGPV